MKDYGAVKNDAGETVELMQPAYVDGDVYRAIGMTAAQQEATDGDEDYGSYPHYAVIWDIIDPCEDGDESHACDWEHPASVTLANEQARLPHAPRPNGTKRELLGRFDTMQEAEAWINEESAEDENNDDNSSILSR